MPNYITNVVTFQQNEKYINHSLSFEEQVLRFKDEINTKLLPKIINKENKYKYLAEIFYNFI